jgi:hypothetical protein
MLSPAFARFSPAFARFCPFFARTGGQPAVPHLPGPFDFVYELMYPFLLFY